MQTLRGYKVKKRKGMLHWEPLLEEWLLANERYCRVMAGEDAPFLYNERAHIGLLSGAAWRCGRVSLEEFQYRKGYKNKPKWLGRADLYMATEDSEELIEAKFRWLSLGGHKTSALAASTLESAVLDAKKTRGTNSSMCCIGVAFLPAYLPRSRGEHLEEKIQNAISSLSAIDCHAVAWCFPKEYRYVDNGDKNITPGVFLVASNISYV